MSEQHVFATDLSVREMKIQEHLLKMIELGEEFYERVDVIGENGSMANESKESEQIQKIEKAKKTGTLGS